MLRMDIGPGEERLFIMAFFESSCLFETWLLDPTMDSMGLNK